MTDTNITVIPGTRFARPRMTREKNVIMFTLP